VNNRRLVGGASSSGSDGAAAPFWTASALARLADHPEPSVRAGARRVQVSLTDRALLAQREEELRLCREELASVDGELQTIVRAQKNKIKHAREKREKGKKKRGQRAPSTPPRMSASARMTPPRMSASARRTPPRHRELIHSPESGISSQTSGTQSHPKYPTREQLGRPGFW